MCHRCGLHFSVIQALRRCKEVKAVLLISCGADAMVKDVISLCTPEKAPKFGVEMEEEEKRPGKKEKDIEKKKESGADSKSSSSSSSTVGDIPQGFFYPRSSLAVDLFPHTPHVETIVLLERSTLMMADDPTDVFDVDFCWTCGSADHARQACPLKED